MTETNSRIALITGAGTGIGRSTAVALAATGWHTVLTGRRREPLESAATEIGTQATVLPADVTNPAEVEALFTAVRSTFGRLDLLFNNAGQGAPPASPDELAVDAWQSVVDVNLTGAFLMARAAFALMRAQDPQGGRIINNGSISAHTPRPYSAPYTATKHAITGLTKSLALDGRPYRIACGQIDIGNAATEMTERMKSGVPQADGHLAAEPTMDVAHVASTIVHMASLPLDANILTLTIMATAMPYTGRG